MRHGPPVASPRSRFLRATLCYNTINNRLSKLLRPAAQRHDHNPYIAVNMQVHAVPDSERAFDSTGRKLPWGYESAE
jgi:hypothetical protein